MCDTPLIVCVPDVALEKIFSFLTYDEIAKNRLVCRKFNDVGGRMLSRGFIQVEKRHSAIHKRVKSLLPRRESERRTHPLSRHCDILQAVETRISMLNMTYMKYIENNLLCFIPGKVLDEMIHVLNFVESERTPPRTHQLLQELRDLSSMAMEHFDEHILPGVKERKEQLNESNQVFLASLAGPSLGSNQPKPLITQQMNDFHKIKKRYKTCTYHLLRLTQITQKMAQKMRKRNRRFKVQSVKIREQERLIQEQTLKIHEHEAVIADMKQHMEEWDRKYKDLTTELIRARDYLLLKTASNNNPTGPAALPKSPRQVRTYRSSIRPRVSQLLLKNYGTPDVERKRKSNLLPDIPLKVSKSQNEAECSSPNKEQENEAQGKSNFSMLFENLLKSRLGGTQSRKRKMSEEIDLK